MEENPIEKKLLKADDAMKERETAAEYALYALLDKASFEERDLEKAKSELGQFVANNPRLDLILRKEFEKRIRSAGLNNDEELVDFLKELKKSIFFEADPNSTEGLHRVSEFERYLMTKEKNKTIFANQKKTNKTLVEEEVLLAKEKGKVKEEAVPIFDACTINNIPETITRIEELFEKYPGSELKETVKEILAEAIIKEQKAIRKNIGVINDRREALEEVWRYITENNL